MAGFAVGDVLSQGEEHTGSEQLAGGMPAFPGETAVRFVRDPATRCYGRSLLLAAGDVVPARVLPYEPTRVKATVKVPPSAIFSGTVRIGQSSDLSGGDGFILYPGESRDIECTDDVYAVASAGVQLSVWVELNPAA